MIILPKVSGPKDKQRSLPQDKWLAMVLISLLMYTLASRIPQSLLPKAPLTQPCPGLQIPFPQLPVSLELCHFGHELLTPPPPLLARALSLMVMLAHCSLPVLWTLTGAPFISTIPSLSRILERSWPSALPPR